MMSRSIPCAKGIADRLGRGLALRNDVLWYSIESGTGDVRANTRTCRSWEKSSIEGR